MGHSERTPTLTFVGGAGTVTGSCFLLETDLACVLVDCGLYQGMKELRLLNWEPLPFDPADVDAVVLTHAHLDHCGALPRLHAEGFAGPIFATPETIALAGIVLCDSGHLNEQDAARANRRSYSRHAPALPLYTEAQAERTLRLLRPLGLHERTEVAPGVWVRATSSGHILGAVSLLVEVEGVRPVSVAFSGDLGRDSHPLLLPPEPRPDADVVVVESTYGDRRHDDAAASDALAQAVAATAARGGTVVIPAFAVDRTEILLVHLAELVAAGRIPELPVYVDSPMALAALGVYRQALAERAPGVRRDIDIAAALDAPNVIETRDVEESKAIDADPRRKIVISASGMATGGRVLHHLARYLPDERACVVLAGFQVPGTRGHALETGLRELRMFGETIEVSADVVTIPAFSAHADREELAAWLAAPSAPRVTYVVHGEPSSSAGLRSLLLARGQGPVEIPRRGQTVPLLPR